MKFNFKQMLKVSAFYLEKQKSFIPKKFFFLSRTTKIDPKDGVSRLNFPEGFGQLFQGKYGREKTGQFCPQFVILNLLGSEDMPDFLS